MAQPHQPGQDPGQAVLGGQAQAGRRGGQLGPGGREAQVAVAGQDQPDAGRRSVDRRDRRRGHAVVEGEGVVELAPHPVAGGGQLLPHAIVVAAGRHVALQRPEVGPRAEAPTGSGHHHHPDRRVGFGLRQAPAVLGVHPAGPGVEPLGAIQSDRRDTVGDLVADYVELHGTSLTPGPPTVVMVGGMAVDLAALVAPWRTAVVTSEVQNGVVGEEAVLPELAEAARETMIPALARLLKSARAASVDVVHATFERRIDGKGANTNARLFHAAAASPVKLLPGTPATKVVPEVGGAMPTDLVLTRTHGLNPMSGTNLEPVLRNLGVNTLVVTGVSVNVAITNLVMEAVNRGFDVVLPRDAVCGIPADYAEAVIDNTLALLATITTVDELVTIWEREA